MGGEKPPTTERESKILIGLTKLLARGGGGDPNLSNVATMLFLRVTCIFGVRGPGAFPAPQIR